MSATALETPTIHALESYDMSAERGFLCRHNARAIELPGVWGEAAAVALELPRILPSGQVRAFLTRHLPSPSEAETVEGLSHAELRMATVHYAFMIQAYIWGEKQPADRLPPELARPMVAIADRLGQQPLLTYSSYVLDNWALVDPDKPLDLSNILMLQNFLGGLDEAWFVLVHVAIESEAGAILSKMAPIVEAAQNHDAQTVQSLLEQTAETWQKLKAIFDRMPERCDPYIYFERVRPYIHGWKDNPALPGGVIYEGVARYGSKGQAFRGQTGSQSSIVPSMDALLGIGHAADPLKAFLDQLHAYRPVGHRQFIDDVRAASQLRGFTQKSDVQGLKDAYNANVQAVADFRTKHLEYAASYINKQGKTSAGNDNEVGTGGTPFMRYLKKHRDETSANLL